MCLFGCSECPEKCDTILVNFICANMIPIKRWIRPRYPLVNDNDILFKLMFLKFVLLMISFAFTQYYCTAIADACIRCNLRFVTILYVWIKKNIQISAFHVTNNNLKRKGDYHWMGISRVIIVYNLEIENQDADYIGFILKSSIPKARRT